MRLKQGDPAHLTPAKRWVVRACLCLLAITLVAQALHLHPNELAQTDVKHCVICQVAHAPVQVAPVAHITFGLIQTAFLSVLADSRPKPVLVSFSLFCRPPPLV
jgi:hypothetical protein